MRLYSLSHLLILAVIGLCSWYAWKRAGLKYILVFLLLFSELSIAVYMSILGIWSWRSGLPLHLCDLAVFGVILTLLYPIQIIWELSYFWVLGGSIAAVLTPDLPRSYPGLLYLLFFATHGTAIVSIFYLLGEGQLQITWNSIGRVWWITNGIAGIMAVLNLAFGTNYFFLCAPPGQFSILQYFGPWPYYLIALEALFTGSLFLSYGIFRVLRGKPC